VRLRAPSNVRSAAHDLSGDQEPGLKCAVRCGGVGSLFASKLRLLEACWFLFGVVDAVVEHLVLVAVMSTSMEGVVDFNRFMR